MMGERCHPAGLHKGYPCCTAGASLASAVAVPAEVAPTAHPGRAEPGRRDGTGHLPWWGRTATAVRQRFVRALTNTRRPPRTPEHVHAAQVVCDRERRWSALPPDSFRFNV